VRAITPLVVPTATYLRSSEQRELFRLGLRLAASEAA